MLDIVILWYHSGVMPPRKKATPRKKAAEQQPLGVHADGSPCVRPGTGCNTRGCPIDLTPHMSPSYRRSSTPVGSSQPSVVRWDPPVYAALKEASLYSNTSMTVIANTAVANYLASPEVRTAIDQAKAAQDDVIRKLSGD